MQLKDTREAINKATAKASDINRQLCFAALGIIWLFKPGSAIPVALQWPTILVISSLIFDLLQYIAATIFITFFHSVKEEELGKSTEETFMIPVRIYRIPELFFWVKLFLNWVAYLLLGWHLMGQLF